MESVMDAAKNLKMGNPYARFVVATESYQVLPAHKTEEQRLRIVGRILVEMNEEGLISKAGLKWLVS